MALLTRCLIANCLGKSAKKCDAYFLDRGEEQILKGSQIDTAIELIERNIDKPIYQQCKPYLEKILEFLRLSKEYSSYVEFIVAV